MRSESFGVIPLWKRGEKWEVFLIQNRNGRHWGFPKGRAEVGETPEQAAQRELFEETALEVDFLPVSPLVESYRFVDPATGEEIKKSVHYFLGRARSPAFKVQTSEIMEGRWVDLEQASSLITHAESQNVCRQARLLIAKGTDHGHCSC